MKKARFELDLAGKSAKMPATGDFLGYVFHVLNYVATISPNAREEEKFDRPFEWLPLEMRADFVMHQRAIAVKRAYKNADIFSHNFIGIVPPVAQSLTFSLQPNLILSFTNLAEANLNQPNSSLAMTNNFELTPLRD